MPVISDHSCSLNKREKSLSKISPFGRNDGFLGESLMDLQEMAMDLDRGEED